LAVVVVASVAVPLPVA
jgi:hypothetical protein